MLGPILFVTLRRITRWFLCLHRANQVRRADYMQQIDDKRQHQVLSVK